MPQIPGAQKEFQSPRGQATESEVETGGAELVLEGWPEGPAVYPRRFLNHRYKIRFQIKLVAQFLPTNFFNAAIVTKDSKMKIF